MQTSLVFLSPNLHAKLHRNFVIACVLATGITAMAPALAGQETRGCNWTLKVDGVTKMSGTANGTAGTVYLARRKAKDNAMACYESAQNPLSSVPSCPNLSGWNKSYLSIRPAVSGWHNYALTVSGENGCRGDKNTFSLWY
jgi:hypothetical protein